MSSRPVADTLLAAVQSRATGQLTLTVAGRATHLWLRGGDVVGAEEAVAFQTPAQALLVHGRLGLEALDALWARGAAGTLDDELLEAVRLAPEEVHALQVLAQVRRLGEVAESAAFEPGEVPELFPPVAGARAVRAALEPALAAAPTAPRAWRCTDLAAGAAWVADEDERAWLATLEDFAPDSELTPARHALLHALERAGLAEWLPLEAWEARREEARAAEAQARAAEEAARRAAILESLSTADEEAPADGTDVPPAAEALPFEAPERAPDTQAGGWDAPTTHDTLAHALDAAEPELPAELADEAAPETKTRELAAAWPLPEETSGSSVAPQAEPAQPTGSLDVPEHAEEPEAVAPALAADAAAVRGDAHPVDDATLETAVAPEPARASGDEAWTGAAPALASGDEPAPAPVDAGWASSPAPMLAPGEDAQAPALAISAVEAPALAEVGADGGGIADAEPWPPVVPDESPWDAAAAASEGTWDTEVAAPPLETPWDAALTAPTLETAWEAAAAAPPLETVWDAAAPSLATAWDDVAAPALAAAPDAVLPGGVQEASEGAAVPPPEAGWESGVPATASESLWGAPAAAPPFDAAWASELPASAAVTPLEAVLAEPLEALPEAEVVDEPEAVPLAQPAPLDVPAEAALPWASAPVLEATPLEALAWGDAVAAHDADVHDDLQAALRRSGALVEDVPADGPLLELGADEVVEPATASDDGFGPWQDLPEASVEAQALAPDDLPVEAEVEADDIAGGLGETGPLDADGLEDWAAGEGDVPDDPSNPDEAARLRRQRLLRRAIENMGTFGARPPAPSAPQGAVPAAPQPAAAAQGMSADEARLAQLIEQRHAALAAKPDHFALLGLEREATREQVKAAFLEQAKRYHPDRLPAGLAHLGPKLSAVFEAVRSAYEVLHDDAKRTAYVMGLQRVEAAAPPPAPSADDPAELAKRAEQLLRKREFAAAEELFARAHTLAPKSGAYLAARAWALYLDPERKADAARAKQWMQDALRLEPTCDRAHYQLGVLARVEGDPERAERHFREAVRHNPQHLEANQELRLLELRKKAQSPRKGLFR